MHLHTMWFVLILKQSMVKEKFNLNRFLGHMDLLMDMHNRTYNYLWVQTIVADEVSQIVWTIGSIRWYLTIYLNRLISYQLKCINCIKKFWEVLLLGCIDNVSGQHKKCCVIQTRIHKIDN